MQWLVSNDAEKALTELRKLGNLMTESIDNEMVSINTLLLSEHWPSKISLLHCLLTYRR